MVYRKQASFSPHSYTFSLSHFYSILNRVFILNKLFKSVVDIYRESTRNVNKNEERKKKNKYCVYSTFFIDLYEKSEISESMRIFYQTKCNVNSQSRWVIIGCVQLTHTNTLTHTYAYTVHLWLCVNIVWLLFPIESKYKNKLHNLCDAKNMQNSYVK